MEKMQESFNTFIKYLEVKYKQIMMNNTITKIKNTLEENNSIITEAGKQINEL